MNATSGEWNAIIVPPARGAGYIDIRGPNDEAIATIFPAAGRGGVGFDAARANGHLIAAAPDLLEACKVALMMVEEPGGFVPNWDLLRAAIRKAVG